MLLLLNSKGIIASYSNEINSTFFEKFPNLVYIVIYIEEAKVTYQKKGRLIGFSDLHEKSLRIKVLSFDGCFLKLSAPTPNQRRASLTFRFLKTLLFRHLSFDDFDQISGVLWLLNSSPSLRLFRASVSRSEGIAGQLLLIHLATSDCLGEMSNLRSVELNSIKGSKPFLLIKFILSHAPNLESVHVKYGVTDRDQRLRITNEFMQFPRASGKGKIIFDG